jgi:hypothetical protein
MNGATTRPARSVEAERDEHLVEINQITKNLKENVHAINNSLDDQGKLIKKISAGVDKNQKKMGFVMGKLSNVLQTKDDKKLYTILLLWAVLMVQLFLLVFV